MADYSKTTWSSGDLITATKANKWETQYDVAKAAFQNGEWSMAADLDMNSHGINNVTDINSGAVDLTDGDIDIASGKDYKIDGAVVISDPGTPSGKYAKDDGTWSNPVGSGDVVGPSSVTADSNVAIYNGTGGKTLKDSLLTQGASGEIYINAHKAVSDPTGTPTGKFAKDDGTWATPTASATYTAQADYLVYKDGSVYNAKNMRTGAIDYSGTVFSTVIISIFTAKADACIHLMSGEYSVTTSIAIYDYEGGAIIGAARNSTTLKATTGLTSGILDIRSLSFVIQNMVIDGDNKTNCVGLKIGTAPGVDSGEAKKGAVRDVEIQNCNKAIWFGDDVDYYVFDRVRMMDGNIYGIYIDVGSGGAYDNGHVQFISCEMSATHEILQRIIQGSGFHRVNFYNCDFHDGHSAAYMVNTSGIHECHFYSCCFESGDGSSMGPGTAMLYLDSYGSGCIDCTFSFKDNTDNTYGAVSATSTYSPYTMHGCVFENQLSGHSACLSNGAYDGLESCYFYNCAGVPFSSISSTDAIEFTIDGHGSAITTGVKGFVEVMYGFYILGWTILADVAGAIVVDVWKDTYTNFPPTDEDSIAGSELPTLVATTQKNQDTSLTTWTTQALATTNILAFNVDSATTVTKVTISLRGVKYRKS